MYIDNNSNMCLKKEQDHDMKSLALFFLWLIMYNNHVVNLAKDNLEKMIILKEKAHESGAFRYYVISTAIIKKS